MNVIIKLYLLLLGVSLYSCDQAPTHIAQLPHDKPKLTYFPSGPDPAVFDLLPVNGDTLLAVKWHGGLALTTDAGIHWKSLCDQPTKPNFLYIKYLTIDNHHVLWGLDSWPGIHEAPYSRLAYSTNFGKTWTRQEFDTHKFFPYTIYSRPNHALQVVTRNGGIYQLQDRINKNWKFIKSITELNNSVDDTTYNDSYYDGAHFKFLETGELFFRAKSKWKPITKIGFISQLDDVCSCAGNTYLFGYNGAVSPTPYYLLKIKNSQIRDTIILSNKEEQMHLRCDGQGRLWVFNFRGIWKKSKNRLLKVY